MIFVPSFLVLVFFVLLFFLGYHFYLLSKPQSSKPLISLIQSFFGISPKATLSLLIFICLFSILFACYFGYYFYTIIPILILLNLFLKSPYLVYLIHLIVLVRLFWFFSPLWDIYLMVSFYRSFACVFSLFAYLFFIYHHKVLILWASGLLRLLLVAGTGDVSAVFAGGGMTLFKSTNITALEKDFSTYTPPTKKNTFFDYVSPTRVPGRTNELLVEQNKREYFPSYTSLFYKQTYVEKIHKTFLNNPKAAILYDLSVLKNFQGDQGSAFTSLRALMQPFFQYYQIDPHSINPQKDAFSDKMRQREGWIYADLPYMEAKGEYHFYTEMLGMLPAIHKIYGYEVAKTFQRGYGPFDGSFLLHDKRYTVDHYLPFKDVDSAYITEKIKKGTDLVVVSNFRNDFSVHTKSHVFGSSGTDFDIMGDFMRDLNKETELLVNEIIKPFSLDFKGEKGYTMPVEQFLKQLNK